MRTWILTLAVLVTGGTAVWAQELPSWSEGSAKEAIVGFVDSVTDPVSSDFVPEGDRIAVFDNDGTLWSEKPLYFQVLFALDRARALAAEDPDFAASPTLRAAADGDVETVLEGGHEALFELVAATHSGMTIEQFQDEVRAWLAEARHPTTDRPYDTMVYQPMLELLDYLRSHGFDVYIVSGGGLDFMRAFAEDAYGIPSENVIGSMGEARFEIIDGVPQIIKDPGILFIDDKEGKPLAIARHIGKRPILVGGNSDGDLAMAQWSSAGAGKRLVILVHHTDDTREFAYDRESAVGRLDRALDEAQAKGWTIVDMADDWKTVWPEH